MGEAGLLVRLKHREKALTQGRVYQHQVRSKMSEVHTDVREEIQFLSSNRETIYLWKWSTKS